MSDQGLSYSLPVNLLGYKKKEKKKSILQRFWVGEPCHHDCAASCYTLYVIHSDVKLYFLSLPSTVDRFKTGL